MDAISGAKVDDDAMSPPPENADRNEIATPLVRALDDLLVDVLPRKGETVRALAERLGYRLITEVGDGSDLSDKTILVPQHFSDSEANHRVARALATPILSKVMDGCADGTIDSVLCHLISRASASQLIEMFAGAILAPSGAFEALPRSTRSDALKLAVRFGMPVTTALARARNFGFVPV